MHKLRVRRVLPLFVGLGPVIAVGLSLHVQSSSADNDSGSVAASKDNVSSGDKSNDASFDFIPTSRMPIAPYSSSNSRSYSKDSTDNSDGSAGIIDNIDISSSLPWSKRVYNFFPSVYRIVNLGVTAGTIVYYYKTSNLKKSSADDDGMAKLHKKLQELQDELDTQVVRRYDASNSEKEVAQWIEKAKQTRMEIEANTELIGQEQAKKSDDEASLSYLHRKCAKKLASMCMQNKGLYIKLGQHISMMDHVIPLEYQEELAKLLSKNPTSPIESVREIVKEDLGKYPEELFSRFELEPIASASLAQVHIAYSKTGEKLAVKVQHKGLLENSAADMKAVTFIVNTLSDMFPTFNYKWLTKEMNRNLPKELDFTAEMGNIFKLKRLLKDLIDSGDIAIPSVFPDCCSRRVLTMSFEEGVFVSNIESIDKLGISKTKLSNLISTVFCEQVFRHGFVHCDPHEANLLVRPHPSKQNGAPQLVILDHGLYRELDDEFRRNYCRLWRALVCSDEAGIKKYAQKMNSGEFFALLGAILTMKPWDEIVGKDINRLQAKSSKGEAVMMTIYAEKYFKQINEVLGKVPSDMLLLLKTNDCLRHLDRILNNPINTALIVLEVSSDVLLREEMDDSTTYQDYATACYNYYTVKSRLLPLKAIDWYLYFKSYFVSAAPTAAIPAKSGGGGLKSVIIKDE